VTRLLSLALAAVGLLAAQRPKPTIDPETRDGLLLEHIVQETDRTEKLHYMEQFASQYPKHPAVLWVYDQLQPAYLNLKQFDDAMRIGDLRLTREPDNLDAAKLTLTAVEGTKDTDLFQKWSDRVWEAAAKAASGPRAEEARQLQSYVEYRLYSMALEATTPQARIDQFQALERRNPKSAYAANLPEQYFEAYREMGNTEKTFEIAQNILSTDPDNTDMLIAVADHYFRKDEHHDRVLAASQKVIEILDTKTRPDSVSEDDWTKKKNQTLGNAYFMGGISSSFMSRYERADSMLRKALPYLEADSPMAAGALYHLGVSNYRMAEAGDTPKAADALRFTRLCAAIKSNFQAQAIKNVEAIRSEYNLP